jgi:Na+/H+-dicarboxylate symporter
MKKRKRTGSRAGFWTIFTATNIVAIGYVLVRYLQAGSGDEQLFAAMTLLFVSFLVVIGDMVSIMLACEAWSHQRR